MLLVTDFVRVWKFLVVNCEDVTKLHESSLFSTVRHARFLTVLYGIVA
jgi:hypothetical protein